MQENVALQMEAGAAGNGRPLQTVERGPRKGESPKHSGISFGVSKWLINYDSYFFDWFKIMFGQY